jgi:signal transduction histidine kinase
MRRTLLTWTIFAAALVLVLTVMAFFTVRILQFERREALAEARAATEENIRLALWRMESAAGGLLMWELARPTAGGPAPGAGPPIGNTRRPRGNKQEISAQVIAQNSLNTAQQRLDPKYQNELSQQEFQQREALNPLAPPAVVNWCKIEPELLESISGLLPGARLEPVGKMDHDDTRRLATIPARLVVPEAAFVPPPLPWNTPLRVSLMIAWICALVASAAVALLLRGALALSERRGAFVSAVTHELRTPLTTFKMYSEMLAGGMVADPESRQQYLDTLVSESDRLGYLIENVLAYARLERQLSPGRAQTAGIGELLDRAVPALRRRAEQAGLAIHVQVSPDAAARTCATDMIAVQQILLNLVDNACKYGRTEIQLNVAVVGDRMEFRVSDRGPGLDPAAGARLFRAFSKSRSDAVPGIGLGLYLSRRLARDLGGDLQHVATPQGATFVLSLPV